MLTVLAIAVLAWPKTMATGLANLTVRTNELTNRCFRDPKSGYYVFSTVECDGSHRSITLTKDRRNVGTAGYDTSRFGRQNNGEAYQQIKESSFALSAGNGIRIGMTPDDVRGKLGKPTRTAIRGKNREFWCALYKKVQMESKEDGAVLRNTYIFKNSKLVEIIVNLDSVPGCGEDSLSDEGWPWSHF